MNKIEELSGKPNVIVKVQGGLGNQLFCYAAARALSIRNKRKCYLDAVSGYEQDQFDRSFKLTALQLPPEVALLSQSVVIDTKSLGARLEKFYPLKFRSYIKEKYVSKKNFVRTSFSSDQLYLEGYWQSEAYFKEIKSQLVGELKFSGKLSETDQWVLKKIKASNSVLVHIRRLNYSQVLDAAYYKSAIKLIQEKLDNPVFFIFGDDLAWVKEKGLFNDTAYNYVEHNDQYHELHDFELMKACQHAIVANSSFSWWGAWLITNPKKVVVAPDHSGFALEMPDRWLKVKVSY